MEKGKAELVKISANEVRVRVRHTSGKSGGFGYRDKFYAVEEDGTVLAPPEAVEEIASHGFWPVDADGKLIQPESKKDAATLELERLNDMRAELDKDRAEFEAYKAQRDAKKER